MEKGRTVFTSTTLAAAFAQPVAMLSISACPGHRAAPRFEMIEAIKEMRTMRGTTALIRSI